VASHRKNTAVSGTTWGDDTDARVRETSAHIRHQPSRKNTAVSGATGVGVIYTCISRTYKENSLIQRAVLGEMNRKVS